MVTEGHAKIKCNCDVSQSDDSKIKTEKCKNDCAGDIKDKCCIFKCGMKNILVDGKVNLEAIASFFKLSDTVNVTASMAMRIVR